MGTGAGSVEASIKNLTAIFAWNGREGLKRVKKTETGSIALSMPENHRSQRFLSRCCISWESCRAFYPSQSFAYPSGT